MSKVGIVVLGCKSYTSMGDRVELAESIFSKLKLYRPIVVFTGYNSEALHMGMRFKREFPWHRLDAFNSFLENKARDTLQNMVYSLDILKSHGITHVYIATSDYHQARAEALFRFVNWYCGYGIRLKKVRMVNHRKFDFKTLKRVIYNIRNNWELLKSKRRK